DGPAADGVAEHGAPPQPQALGQGAAVGVAEQQRAWQQCQQDELGPNAGHGPQQRRPAVVGCQQPRQQRHQQRQQEQQEDEQVGPALPPQDADGHAGGVEVGGEIGRSPVAAGGGGPGDLVQRQ